MRTEFSFLVISVCFSAGVHVGGGYDKAIFGSRLGHGDLAQEQQVFDMELRWMKSQRKYFATPTSGEEHVFNPFPSMPDERIVLLSDDRTLLCETWCNSQYFGFLFLCVCGHICLWLVRCVVRRSLPLAIVSANWLHSDLVLVAPLILPLLDAKLL